MKAIHGKKDVICIKNKVLGYQHTGITLAMDKLKFSNSLNPDTIITTGPKTKEILINKFQHKKKRHFWLFS